MSEKASAEELKKFIKQVGELDELADENSSKFSDWEIKFLDEQADRLDEFGKKTYVSKKQAEAIDKIYRKVILGEDVRAEADGGPTRKRNRAANRAAE